MVISHLSVQISYECQVLLEEWKQLSAQRPELLRRTNSQETSWETSTKGSPQNNDTVSLEEGWYSVTIWGLQGLSPSVLQGYIIIYQAGGIHGSKQTEMKQSVAAHCVGSWGRWQCRVRHKARETGGQAVERLQCSIRQYGCEPLEISEELSKGTEMMITFIF